MRTCTKCGETKPLSDFNKSVKGKDGYRERCRTCQNEENRAYKQRNVEKVAAARKEYKQRNAEKVAAANKEYKQRNKDRLAVARKADYEKNKERVLQQSREWYEANKDRRNERGKQWTAANRGRVSYLARQYQLRRTKAVPPWVDWGKIDAIYAEARMLRAQGVNVHVDHIMPLRGKTSCGLHWHGNLQLLPASENLRKSNREIDGLHLAYP